MSLLISRQLPILSDVVLVGPEGRLLLHPGLVSLAAHRSQIGRLGLRQGFRHLGRQVAQSRVLVEHLLEIALVVLCVELLLLGQAIHREALEVLSDQVYLLLRPHYEVLHVSLEMRLRLG